MAVTGRKPGYMSGYEAYLGPLQRPFLKSSLKRSNGNFSSGASGINVADTHSMEWKPSMGQPGAKPGPAGAEAGGPMVDYLSKVAMDIQDGGQANPKNVQPGTVVQSATPTTTSGQATPSGTTATPGATGTAATPGFTFSGDYAADAQRLITMLQKISSTPFQYNSATDPSYIAAKQSLELQAGAAKDKTYADMADRGILNSSVTSGQLGSIEQQSVQSLAQVVPGLEANAFGRYQQNISNQSNVIQSALGQMNFQQGFEADQRWREADATGTVESPEYKMLFDSLIGAKQGWASTTDPAERKKFAEQGKSARAAIAATTGRTQAEVDQMFGGNVGIDAAKGNYGLGGQQTVAEKARIEAGQRYKDETTYAHGQDTKAWGYKEKDFTENVRHNKVMEAKSSGSGGGSSGGPSYTEVLKGNTNQLVSEMLAEISDPADTTPWDKKVSDWVYANGAKISQAGVNASDLYAAADKVHKGLGGGTDQNVPLTGAALTDKVLAAAQKDSLWEAADTPEKRQEILDYYTGLYKTHGPSIFQRIGDKVYKFFEPYMPKNMPAAKNPPATKNPPASTKKTPTTTKKLPASGGRTYRRD